MGRRNRMDRIVLPKPVSVNALYRTTCRNGYASVYMSRRGKEWFNEAMSIIHSKRIKKHIDNDCIVYVWLYTCRNGDIDNISKVSLDLLQHTGVIENDKQVVELHLYKERVHKVKDEKMEMQVERWEE